MNINCFKLSQRHLGTLLVVHRANFTVSVLHQNFDEGIDQTIPVRKLAGPFLHVSEILETRKDRSRWVFQRNIDAALRKRSMECGTAMNDLLDRSIGTNADNPGLLGRNRSRCHDIRRDGGKAREGMRPTRRGRERRDQTGCKQTGRRNNL